MCRRISSQLVWISFSHHGLSGARFGWMLSNPAIRGFLQTSCCSATFTFRWCITTESSSEGCHIMHSGETTSPVCGCSCSKQRPWHNVIWCLRFRAVQFHRVMLAPVMWSLSRPGRLDVSVSGYCTIIVQYTTIMFVLGMTVFRAHSILARGRHPLSALFRAPQVSPGESTHIPSRPKSTPPSVTGFREPPRKPAWLQGNSLHDNDVFPVWVSPLEYEASPPLSGLCQICCVACRNRPTNHLISTLDPYHSFPVL